MKFVAGVLLFLTIAALIGLMIFKGRAFDMWTVVALAVPCLGLLIMLFSSVREKILDFASWLPFVKYQRPEPPSGAGNG
jgi:peptidoglycan/LPS O-acetylase OafA/YrhL